MKDFEGYKKKLRYTLKKAGYEKDDISAFIKYASNLDAQNLPIIFNYEHFSQLVGYQDGFILQLSNSNDNYKEFRIPKKNGGFRVIDEPLPSLKEIQTWILQNILVPASKQKVSLQAKAFMPKINIRDNAKFHRGQKKVVCLDIKDFFPSIKYYHVYSLFKSLGYSKGVSTLLSRLCTYKECMPQGAPTSPMLSNMIMLDFDNKLFSFCRKKQLRYTRYADDITISGNDIIVPEIISYVNVLLKEYGFRINEKKTKVLGRGICQHVTGITVNQKLQASRQYRMKVRQEIYYIHKYGLLGHMSRANFKGSPTYYLHHLIGKLNFILMVNSKDEKAKRDLEFLKLLDNN